MNHIRVRKWVCYDWYFEVWQARVAPWLNGEDKPCQFEGRDEHGLMCGFYHISIEDIEEAA